MPGTVEGLVAVARSFIPEAAGEKRRLLDQLDASDLDDPKALIACHDALLFLLAYPQTRELHAAAKRALDRVAAAAGTLAKRSRRARRGLEESGIAWSEIRVVLSYPGARWLATRHPKHAEIAFFGGDATPLASILGLAFGTLEETTLATERSSLELLKALAAGTGGTRLQWLVRELDRLPSSDPIRDHLFLSLEAFVLIEPRDGPLSRTFARGLPAAPFVHRRGLRRIVDPRRLLDRPLPAPRRLTERDRWRVIDAGRAVLAMIGRETEPIVECLPSGVQYLELERGFAIALFHLPPDRRPLDPHVGLVMFKNGLPIAYGGGWPFLRLCRIGIHIFAPYRGGESSYLFAQVLRVYRQRFGIRRFVAEPTQFGAGDPDGLTSGAFCLTPDATRPTSAARCPPGSPGDSVVTAPRPSEQRSGT